MKQEVTLKEIVSLLNSLEGVKVLDTECTSHSLGILLTIESNKSHFWLESCAEGANVSFRCCTRYRPSDKEAITNPALALVYEYELTKEDDSTVHFEYFNYLGSWLVWVMHPFGKIETKEANRLLDMWDSMHVGERKRLTDNLNNKTT